MKKFNFRLEKIKKYKEQLEQSQKMKLAKKQASCLIEKNILSSIISTKNRYFSKYGIRVPGKVNVNKLIITKMYIDKLSRDIVNQNEKVTVCEKNVADAQKELLKAMREKKKYDKLKEKHLKAYNKEMIRCETNELDEFGARSIGSDFAGISS
ncbi:MAG TPA: flagellar export protein FliJ [Bacteroidetes bacterium]|nr:flagellar export protein FliJ [Bacteroidota bacterium]